MGLDNAGNVWLKNEASPISGGTFIASEYITLYPAKAVGDTWSSQTSYSQSGFTMNYLYSFKILEKNISATVGGKNYTNGIRFSFETKIGLAGSTASSSTLEYAYLCGLGVYTLKTGNQITSTTTKYTY